MEVVKKSRELEHRENVNSHTGSTPKLNVLHRSGAKGTWTDEERTRTRFLSSRTLVSSFILGEAGKVSTTAGAARKWVL
ncbi:hypothetical protein KOW79_013012 [Hemibagrus wyckioides]|uniref:Uncharacterized protein n=1 Tax=Hemibagrus wyckioides TaxID=337641 RepID=A0A9D3NLS4_9TELE|nr:hypothetical protein KOW79_013012 [Hemibagrus wyckioides]